MRVTRSLCHSRATCKKGLDCIHAIYTVHRTVERFTKGGNTVNLCAIDLSIAFDKVNLHALFIQEALLLQRDRVRHLSVEILQLQNMSLENPIVWHYLCDSTFSHFDTIPECDRHTHRQKDGHTAL